MFYRDDVPSWQRALERLKRWKDWMLAAERFAKGRICAVCGRPGFAREDLPLCRFCLERVPWIGEIRCPVCGRDRDCPDCLGRSERFLQLNQSAVRYDETMKNWLARYKYRGDERLKGLLARMMLPAYHRLLSRMEKRKVDCLTFVPASPERLAERGFNQAEQLARELGGLLRLPVVPLLERVRHTPKQSQKSRRERLRGMEGVFRPIPPDSALPVLLGKKRLSGGIRQEVSRQVVTRSMVIVIVDDVYTTGSTMNACARQLSGAFDCEVYGLTWARS